MISMTALGIGIGVLVCLATIWAMVSTSKVRWYKVYLANNVVRLMCRTSAERWKASGKNMVFKDDTGRECTFPSEAHWILMYEQIPAHEVEMVRQQLVAERERRLKEESES